MKYFTLSDTELKFNFTSLNQAHPLTRGHKPREIKQLFYAIIANSMVECAFYFLRALYFISFPLFFFFFMQ